MYSAIYIEKEVETHTKTASILDKFNDSPHIICNRYQEIFNRKNQNFRLQKSKPALILAKKYGKHVLPIPEGYGIGGENNYYFSHMLNCIYDCRYCFLQGMYRSAHNVLFVNHDEFENAIEEKIQEHKNEEVYFFSGYDCDSLALEPISGFIKNILPLFERHKKAWLELRTKSTQIRNLTNREPLENCIVAYSLSPQSIVKSLEHKTPSLQKRIDAIIKLQQQGWPIGLRFDPIIYTDNFQKKYSEFFAQLFSQIDLDNVHSVTLGSFRLPTHFHKNIAQLYPDEALFAAPQEKNNKMVQYPATLSNQMLQFCEQKILEAFPKHKYFPTIDE